MWLGLTLRFNMNKLWTVDLYSQLVNRKMYTFPHPFSELADKINLIDFWLTLFHPFEGSH